MSEGTLIAIIVVAFTVVFGGFWLLITTILGRISGWIRLQNAFPDKDEPPLERLSLRSARLGGINFNNCLTFDVCPTGLRVSVMRILGPFQKPFFVPWGQIRPERHKVLIVNYVRLHLGMQQEGALSVHEKTYRQIASRSPLREDF